MGVLLSDILRATDMNQLKDSGTTITYQHRRAFEAIQLCRTASLGRIVYECEPCSRFKIAYSSCGNRHCPQCQGQKTLDWIQKQVDRQLPVEYFLLTFTVPEALRPLVYRLQDKAYSAMFEASASVIRTLLGQRKRKPISTLGFTSLLHTWGRQLQYHPHIHILLPGGGLTEDGTWISLSRGFGINVLAASELWMGALLKLLEALVGRSKLPPNICDQDFVVHCKSMGNGHNAVRYLSRYVFKVAIHQSRLIKLEGGKVTFRYKDRQDKNRQKIMQLDVQEFTRRFAMHILPRGFVKVRHYGYHHPNSKIDIDELRVKIMKFSEDLLGLIRQKKRAKQVATTASSPVPKPTGNLCPCCGAPMRLMSYTRMPETVMTG